MREKLAALAREIRAGYDGIARKARSARESDSSLAVPIGRAALSLSVCAVDGGLLAERMHGADIVVCRAVAAVFAYRDSALESSTHIPARSPRPEIQIQNSLEGEHEALAFRSLIRLKAELSCALSALESARPGMLLIDGSLLPLPSDRPQDGSALRPLYDEVISRYRELFEKCDAGGCLLCGVVKDSRARRLSQSLGASCSDTILCGYLLKAGERTRDSEYFEGKAPNADVAALGRRIRVFYMKASEKDLPLRIEVLGDKADAAAPALLALSSISENFAYPAPLIEADMCAALDPAELEPIEASLAALSGLRPLRRNSRPFR